LNGVVFTHHYKDGRNVVMSNVVMEIIKGKEGKTSRSPRRSAS
jgi:hypothetical protein